MELMSQPFSGQLGYRLIELLASENYHTFNFAVAFAKNSGVLRIKDALERFRERGGKVNAFVGVDLGGTSYEALTALLLHTDSLSVVHAEQSQTFHVKIYQFLGEHNELAIVGSHNLTGGGLWTNFESSVFVSIDESNADRSPISKELDEFFERLGSLKDSFMPIKEHDDIEKLLQHGYVAKEVAERIHRTKSTKNEEALEALFGKGVSAKLPSIAVPKEEVLAAKAATPKSISLLPTEDGPTIWFETRKMTGGSRNILDLSMKSLVEKGDPKGTPFDLGDTKFMRGAVEFFGLDPNAAAHKKDITINFDGVDYSGNTILFPTGQHANGTWRLQIKGTSPSEVGITEALREKDGGHYLVEKVITFTKIEDDYYFMSVFPETEIENFKAASRIVARNGSSGQARLLGIL